MCARSSRGPVEIGKLQRFATDELMRDSEHPYTRDEDTGKSVAVVGAGPAGLACAHRLAMKGNSVTIYDCKRKGGGLNEYGIAAYKTVNEFAAREVEWILGIGGIRLELGNQSVDGARIEELRQSHDAVFLAFGLAGVNTLTIEGNKLQCVMDAVDFIASIRQANNVGEIPVGRNVVVIGGGMTAIDAAVQSRLLGAQSVTLVYRRTLDDMGASKFERDLATSKGVKIITNSQPTRIIGAGGVQQVEFEYTEQTQAGLQGTGETFTINADLVLRAIGQNLVQLLENLRIENGKIWTDEFHRTNIDGLWAGGDCTAGKDLTVVAVAEGRDAAEDIHKFLNH